MDQTMIQYVAGVIAIIVFLFIIVSLLNCFLMKEQPYKPHIAAADDFTILNNAGMHAKKRRTNNGQAEGIRRRIEVSKSRENIKVLEGGIDKLDGNLGKKDITKGKQLDSQESNKLQQKHEKIIDAKNNLKVEKNEVLGKPSEINIHKLEKIGSKLERTKEDVDLKPDKLNVKLKVDKPIENINDHKGKSSLDSTNRLEKHYVENTHLDTIVAKKVDKGLKSKNKALQENFDQDYSQSEILMVEEIVKAAPILNTESICTLVVNLEDKKKKKKKAEDNINKSAKSSDCLSDVIKPENVSSSNMQQSGIVQNNLLNMVNNVPTNVSTQIDNLKKQLEAKERAFQEEEKQKQQLNNVIAKLNSELNQYIEYKKKHDKTAEELQALRTRLHQSELANGQTVGNLQNELKNAQTKSNEYSKLMGKLAEENAKLTDNLKHINQTQHISEDITQKLKSVDVLNETLKNTQIALGTTENAKRSLEAKLKIAEDKVAFQEAKMKEVGDKYKVLESKHQQQPNSQDLEIKLKQALSEKMDLEKKVALFKKDIETEKFQKTAPNNVLNGDISKLGEMEKTINSLQDEKIKLTDFLKNRETELNWKSSTIVNLEKEIIDMKSNLAAFEASNKEIQDLKLKLANRDNLEKELNDLKLMTSKINEYEKEVSDLKFKLKKHDALEKEVCDLKSKNEIASDLEKQVKELKSKLIILDKTEKQVEDLKSKVAYTEELEKEIKDLKLKTVNLDNLEKEVIELQSKTSKNSEAEMKKITEQLKILEYEKKNYANDRKDLLKQLEVAKQEVQVKAPVMNQQFAVSSDTKLSAEVENLKIEKLKLLDELNVKNKKNEELRIKSHKTVEALQEAENKCTSLMSETETLRREVQSKSIKLMDLELKEKERGFHSEKVDTINKVSDGAVINGEEGEYIMQIEVQKSKNDELRKKNWTMMSALRDTERKLAEREVELSQCTKQLNQFKNKKTMEFEEPITERREYTFVTQVKESCQWDLSQLVLDLDTKKAEIEILQSLLEQNEDVTLQQENKKLKEIKTGNFEADLTKELKSLQKENATLLQRLNNEKDLKNQIDHYKRVLSDTEKILFDLQASVEREESKWSLKVNNLEQEIKQLKK